MKNIIIRKTDCASSTQLDLLPQNFQSAPLGIATKLRTLSVNSYSNKTLTDFETGEFVKLELDDSEKILAARRARYELQNFASTILYRDDAPRNDKGYQVQHRTCNCTRLSISNGADLYKSKEHSKVHYSGLMKCANSRTCPVCSAVISERKSNEMRLAANQASALGLNFSLLTFTAPHTASDSLDDLVQMISKALQRFWRGAPAKRFKEKFGIVGHIRSFEIRYGVNGWHPHFHIILVSKSKLPTTNLVEGKFRKPLPLENQHEDWQWIFNRWLNCCTSEGLSSPNLYGMDLQNGAKAGEYITKFGSNSEILETKTGKKITWDMCDEISKGNVKSSKTSMSPFDLLSEFGSLSYDNPEHYLSKVKFWSLFNEYAHSTKGLSLIKWSRGLRSLFGLSENEPTDAEILAKEDDACDLLCHINSDSWKFIVKNGFRSLVLELAENGGSQAVFSFLRSHGLHVTKGAVKTSSDGDFTPVEFAVSSRIDIDEISLESLKYDSVSHYRVRKSLSHKRKSQDSLLGVDDSFSFNESRLESQFDETPHYDKWLKDHTS